MPKIVFDPDGELDTCPIPKRNRFSGGGLTGEKRCEYVHLCKLMTSRDISLKYDEIRDAILAIMKEDVIAHIQTLPEDVRPALLADIEQFYGTIDFTDNPLTIINIIGLQTALLFTKYLDPKNNASQEPYNPDLSSLEFYTTITGDDTWKTYSEIKPQIKDFCEILSNDDPRTGISTDKPIFMIFLGFTTLGELMESYFNTVFYYGLAYERDYVDNGFYNPLEVIEHDYGHYLGYRICLKNPLTINTLKEFHKYVSSTKEKSILYAINFALFILLHEDACYSFTNIIYKLFEDEIKVKFLNTMSTIYLHNHELRRKNERKYIEQKVQEMNSELLNHINKDTLKNIIRHRRYEICQLTFLGMAVPKAYRVINEVTKELEEEKVLEYIDLVVSLYDDCYKEFMATKMGGGRRKRLTRKRRVNRKQKKTKKSRRN